MKKLIAMLLALVMVLAMVACANTEPAATEPAATEPAATESAATEPAATEPAAPAVMSYADYVAAALDSQVVIECYVQDSQGWWFDSNAGYGKITVYAQDKDGGYFLYEMKCEEADAAKLVPGTKICVTGYKGEWAGEVEVMDGSFTFVEGGDTFIAEAKNVTDLLGTDEMINHQNEFVSFYGMTVKAIEYKNGEPGDDIYLTLSKDGADYNFCVEVYLTGTDSDVYNTVAALAEGDVVNVEAFLYWYEGMNPHITSIMIED